MKLANLKCLLTSLGLAAALVAAPATAGVVFDRSVDAIGGLTNNSFASSNVSLSQYFLVGFSLSSTTNLGGADIYSAFATNMPLLGASVTIQLRSDSGGAPAGSDLFNFTSTLSAIDSDGTILAPNSRRLHADFSAVTLSAGNYWFGMSGTSNEIGWDIDFGNNGTGDGYQAGGANNLFFPLGPAALPFRLYDDSHAVPEPASGGLLLMALGGMGYVLRRRKGAAAAF